MATKGTVLARFMGKVEIDETGCWLWRGVIDAHGYGRFTYQRHPHYAHRWIWEQTHGPLPRYKRSDGRKRLTLDHLCRVRHCVNIAHLELVTNRENILRGDSLAAQHARKTHCPKGHEYAVHGRMNRQGQRKCRLCEREYSRTKVRAWKRANIAPILKRRRDSGGP